MQMPFLELDFDSKPKIVQANAEAIDVEIKKMKAVIMYLEGLHVVNQSVCLHEAKKDVYEPGYTGGYHDGYKCPTCGKRGYF